LVEILCAMRL